MSRLITPRTVVFLGILGYLVYRFASAATDESSRQWAAFALIFCVAWPMLSWITAELATWKIDPSRDPSELYVDYVNRYFAAERLPGYNDIQIPSPHHYSYRKNSSVWDGPGFWQDQWRAYSSGQPSVYGGQVPLPPVIGEPEIPKFGVRVWFASQMGGESTVPRA